MRAINFLINRFFLGVLFVAIIFSNALAEEQVQAGAQSEKPAEAQKPLYTGGPWTGVVIDAETKKPVEGAVVAAVWYRVFDIRFNKFKYFHEAKEVLTDDKGYFEIPAYTETGEGKDSWPKPNLPGIKEDIKFFISGPIISNPDIIIYKPGFNNYPDRTELIIFAVKPASVEYIEYFIGKVNNEEVTLYRNKTKDFTEGLVYRGMGCHHLLEKWVEKAPYAFDSFFIQAKGAGEKVNKLEVNLNCPDKAEPVPSPIKDRKSALDNPFNLEGGHVIIGLSRLTSDKERSKALPQISSDEISADKIPLLSKLINEEKEKISAQKEEKKEEKKDGKDLK